MKIEMNKYKRRLKRSIFKPLYPHMKAKINRFESTAKRYKRSLNCFSQDNKVVMDELIRHFDGDEQKTLAWLHAKNPHLGSVRPIELIIAGREEKLIKFIETALDENTRSEISA